MVSVMVMVLVLVLVIAMKVIAARMMMSWVVKVEYNPLRLTHPHLISQMVILTQSDFELPQKIIWYFTNLAPRCLQLVDE